MAFLIFNCFFFCFRKSGLFIISSIFSIFEYGKDESNKIISRDKRILGGTAVFRGTRVPIEALWDYLKAGDTLEEFLEDFPSVGRKQAIALIERAQERVLS